MSLITIQEEQRLQDQKQPNSIAALKVNLCYAEIQKQKAYDAHYNALLSYSLALDTLNQAICKKNNQEG